MRLSGRPAGPGVSNADIASAPSKAERTFFEAAKAADELDNSVLSH